MESAKKKRITLKMIAEEAGLSITAVSQILNHSEIGFCSEANKENVQKIADRLGYRPNVGVKIMRGEKLKSVAVVLNMNQMELDEHIQRIILMLFRRYEEQHYSCYFCSGERDAEQNLTRIRTLLDYGVERFLFIGKPFGGSVLHDEIKQSGRTAIYYDTIPYDGSYCAVHSDTVSAVADMMRYLRAEQYKNIAFFQLAVDPDDQRFLGLCQAFPDYTQEQLMRQMIHTLPFDARTSDNFLTASCQCGRLATERLLAERPDTDAIFLYSDAFALGAVPILLRHYLQTGKQIALAGFNYTHAVQSSVYPIFSAQHPLEKIVTALMSDFSTPRTITVKPELRIPEPLKI